jgi:hypothetical protein
MRNDHERIILTDVDGVLLNWGYAFKVWMEQKGYDVKDPDVYNVDKIFDMERAESKKMVRHFNESASIGFLPPLRDAIHYVRKLHEEHGYVFHAITSLSLDPHAAKLREQNLAKLFGETAFEKVVCLDTGADKDEALEPYRDSNFVWIEDKVENAEVGDKLGLDSILIEHAYNMDNKDFPLMKDWKEVYNYLEG